VRFSSVHPNFLKTGMFEGAQLRGLGALLFPRVDGHDVIADAVVSAALLRGRRVVKRPRSLRLVLLLRGILPDRVFGAIGRLAKLHTSMDTWRGRSKDRSAA
jgi:all-trans-retinol dehydrogenase (NAD+)